MKNKVKIIIMVLFVFICFNIITYSGKTAVEEQLDKVYCDVSIDEDFSDNTIVVVLNKNASLTCKEYNASDFEEVNCKNVIDLSSEATSVVVGKTENNLINKDNYKRILRNN